jgi:hypothetical protein
MTSLLARLVSPLRDIRIPFPMTQAPAAPSVSAIADPATGTVDISGIIYKLESLVASYEGALKQVADQLENIKIPPDLESTLLRNARESARVTIASEAAMGTLMNSNIRDQIHTYVGARLEKERDLVESRVQSYIDSYSSTTIRDAARSFFRESRDELVGEASTKLELKGSEISRSLTDLWTGRMNRLVADRKTLKESLLALVGDEMRELAREILAETAKDQGAGLGSDPSRPGGIAQ